MENFLNSFFIVVGLRKKEHVFGKLRQQYKKKKQFRYIKVQVWGTRGPGPSPTSPTPFAAPVYRALISFETLLTTSKTAWRHNPEVHNRYPQWGLFVIIRF
jgi:hypothetical protein